MRTALHFTAILAGVLAATPGQAQTPPQGGATGQGSPPVATGRQEGSAAISGTAGHSGSSVLSKQDFVRLAASNAMYETEAARLALQRAKDERERQFAQTMLDTHSKATEELRGLLQSDTNLRGIQMPDQLADQYRIWITQLRAAQGADFQALYVQQQADAHLIALDLFRNYSQVGDDEALKRWAASRLPVLQDHFEKVQALKGNP